MNDTSTLASVPLFSNLAPEELIELGTHLRRVVYPARTEIITAEDPGDEAFIVMAGTVKICVDQPDGRHVILAILGAGALVGEISVVQRAMRSASVVTLERTVLQRMRHDDFLSALQRYPTMALNLSAILAQRLRLANARILSYASERTASRVARLILDLAREHGLPQPNGDLRIPIRLTQSDLANLVDLSRTYVNQAIVGLKSAHVLSVNAQYQITVHDLAALEQHSQ